MPRLHRYRSWKKFTFIIAGALLLLVVGVVCFYHRGLRAYVLGASGFHPHAEDSRILVEEDTDPDHAHETLRVLDTAIADIERVHGRTFSETPHVYICASQESFNWRTAASPDGNGRGAVFANRLYLSPRTFTTDTCQGILTHELSHLHLRQVLGSGYTTDIPGWFQEGLAVYASDGGGAEPISRKEALDVIRRGETFTPEDHGSAIPRTAREHGLQHHMFYKQAGMFVEFMAESDLEQFDAFLSELFEGRVFDDAFLQVYSREVEQVHERFVDAVEREEEKAFEIHLDTTLLNDHSSSEFNLEIENTENLRKKEEIIVKREIWTLFNSFVVVIVLLVPQICPAPFGGYGPVQLKEFVSDSERFTLRVEPTKRDGNGPCNLRLTEGDRVVWEREYERMLYSAVVLESGHIAAYSYDKYPQPVTTFHSNPFQLVGLNNKGEVIYENENVVPNLDKGIVRPFQIRALTANNQFNWASYLVSKNGYYSSREGNVPPEHHIIIKDLISGKTVSSINTDKAGLPANHIMTFLFSIPSSPLIGCVWTAREGETWLGDRISILTQEGEEIYRKEFEASLNKQVIKEFDKDKSSVYLLIPEQRILSLQSNLNGNKWAVIEDILELPPVESIAQQKTNPPRGYSKKEEHLSVVPVRTFEIDRPVHTNNRVRAPGSYCFGDQGELYSLRGNSVLQRDDELGVVQSWEVNTSNSFEASIHYLDRDRFVLNERIRFSPTEIAYRPLIYNRMNNDITVIGDALTSKSLAICDAYNDRVLTFTSISELRKNQEGVIFYQEKKLQMWKTDGTLIGRVSTNDEEHPLPDGYFDKSVCITSDGGIAVPSGGSVLVYSETGVFEREIPIKLKENDIRIRVTAVERDRSGGFYVNIGNGPYPILRLSRDGQVLEKISLNFLPNRLGEFWKNEGYYSLMHYSKSGEPIRSIQSPTPNDGVPKLMGPSVDYLGNLYFQDSDSKSIYIYTDQGQFRNMIEGMERSGDQELTLIRYMVPQMPGQELAVFFADKGLEEGTESEKKGVLVQFIDASGDVLKAVEDVELQPLDHWPFYSGGRIFYSKASLDYFWEMGTPLNKRSLLNFKPVTEIEKDAYGYWLDQVQITLQSPQGDLLINNHFTRTGIQSIDQRFSIIDRDGNPVRVQQSSSSAQLSQSRCVWDGEYIYSTNQEDLILIDLEGRTTNPIKINGFNPRYCRLFLLDHLNELWIFDGKMTVVCLSLDNLKEIAQNHFAKQVTRKNSE